MIIPCTAPFAVLIRLDVEGEPVDYTLEPVIAWMMGAGEITVPITLRGAANPDDPILRPDESVRCGQIDFPDFGTFLSAMRAVEREDDDEPVTPAKLVAGAVACIKQGQTSKPPKLAP